MISPRYTMKFREISAPSGGNFPVTFGIANPTGSSIGSGSTEFSFGHTFAKGDVPSGYHVASLAPQAGGSAVSVQQDRESYWNDGSLRYAALSTIQSDTFLATATRNYSVSAASGAPNRSAWTTWATALTGHDFKLKFYDGDLGGTDVFWVQVNEIISSGGSAFPWGSYPLRGWEDTDVGPNKIGRKWWGWLKRASDSAYHKWLRADIFIDAWSTGKFSIGVYPSQPGCYGTFNASQTVGAASLPPRYCYVCELYDGSTLLYAWGGANDSRLVTFGPSAVSTGASTITLDTDAHTANYATTGGGSQGFGTSGVPVTFSTTGASLPGGLVAGTVYWPYRLQFQPASNHALFIGVNRSDAQGPIAAPTSGAVPLTTQGSIGATITMTPLAPSFQNTGWLGLDADCERIWVGGSRPLLYPVHDKTYMTRKAFALPWYDFTGTITSYPLQTPAPPHSVGLPQWQGFETAGDSPDDERIGYANFSSLQALYNPTDYLGWVKQSKVQAAGWADLTTNWIDERYGLPPVGNIGPDRLGGNYTNLLTNSNLMVDFAGTGSPGRQTLSSAGADQPSNEQYTSWNTSHQPRAEFVPYLMTGDPIWHELLLRHTTAVLSSGAPNVRNLSVSGTSYGGVFTIDFSQQIRGCAWGVATIGALDHSMPGSHPMRQYVKDCLDDCAAVLWPYWQANFAGQIAIGLYANAGNGRPTTFASYMLGMVGQVFGLEAAKGERPGWLAFLNNVLINSLVGFYDSDVGGSELLSCAYWWDCYIPSGDGVHGVTYYSTPSDLLVGNLGPSWASLIGPDWPPTAPKRTVTSITCSGTTATVTTAAPHGLGSSGPIYLIISGATPSGYNTGGPDGAAMCTLTGASTFTYQVASNPGPCTVPGTYSGHVGFFSIVSGANGYQLLVKAGLAMCSVAGMTGAEKVHDRIAARVATDGGVPWNDAVHSISRPTWAILKT